MNGQSLTSFLPLLPFRIAAISSRNRQENSCDWGTTFKPFLRESPDLMVSFFQLEKIITPQWVSQASIVHPLPYGWTVVSGILIVILVYKLFVQQSRNAINTSATTSLTKLTKMIPLPGQVKVSKILVHPIKVGNFESMWPLNLSYPTELQRNIGADCEIYPGRLGGDFSTLKIYQDKSDDISIEWSGILYHWRVESECPHRKRGS